MPPALTHHFSAAEVDDLKQTFSTYDSDSDGVLSLEECRQVVNTFAGRNCGDYEIQSLLRLFDADANGTMDLDEFLKFNYAVRTGFFDRPVSLKDAFVMANRSRTGKLTHRELRHLLKTNESYSKEQVKNILSTLDTRLVSYPQFIRLVNRLEKEL
ncbi:uncharacterized protein BJ171DRAFT_488262 [Polychytrium aggregatum]|uniref:uncharacterized protein n=1 Tax=Polychytrium aggregatum TaxID=110093 RepID=UPI0022FE9C51|nr:uncharacterized protein BJ171DRAFT_488262 [Polychytrium aggregatum]KAI9209034.1 hypothetical protein BJ171DRAFT_488262 [Polychytrium aggregatum]